MFRFGTFLENELELDFFLFESLEPIEAHDKKRGNRLHVSRMKVPQGSRKMTNILI